MLYFESQPFTAALHAMRRSRAAGRTFFHCHALLCASCILVGAGLKMLLVHVDHPLAPREVWLTGGCLAATLALVLVVRMSHRGWRSELGYVRRRDAAVKLVARGPRFRRHHHHRHVAAVGVAGESGAGNSGGGGDGAAASADHSASVAADHSGGVSSAEHGVGADRAGVTVTVTPSATLGSAGHVVSPTVAEAAVSSPHADAALLHSQRSSDARHAFQQRPRANPVRLAVCCVRVSSLALEC